MLVVGGVPLALVAAGAAGHRTRLDHCAHDADIGCGLAGDDATRGVAGVRAVEAEANAADHLLHVLLTEAGIGTAGAGSGTVEALLDAVQERVAINARRLRMRRDDLSNRHVVSSLVRTSIKSAGRRPEAPYASGVSWRWALIGFGAVLVLYLVLVLVLVVAGRRGDARALAGFVPDCVVLFKRLLSDPRVAWWRKALLAGVIVYLVSPIDLVPDFIPVAGQLDDAIVVALVLRRVLRGSGAALLHEHWPGPPQSLLVIRRVAYGRGA